MCAPFFRASQQISLSSLTDASLFIPPVQFDDGLCYDFTHITTERGDVYETHTPSVRWVVRIVAVPRSYTEIKDEDGHKIRIDHKTWFEPSWFSIHVYWEWVKRGEIEKRDGSRDRVLVDACMERILEYLEIHEEPFPSEEYDPIILEIY